MERLPTYEQLYASFRWNIPARYNIAADVCDRHAADPSKVALILAKRPMARLGK
jgi:acetyl-CoA synthetase